MCLKPKQFPELDECKFIWGGYKAYKGGIKNKQTNKFQSVPFIQQRPLAFRPLWPNLGDLSLLELTSYYEAENTWGKMNIW